jgi:uncharacterized protein (TIGR02217 family)
MTPFSETRLPVRLAFGSTGGIERRTRIVALASGYETRETPWAHGRRHYLVKAALRSFDEAATLSAFFEARRGRLQGFQFLDFADNLSCPLSRSASAADQVIGTGDGASTAFQLVKLYGSGAEAYLRPIAKPVAGTVRVAVAGVELTTAQFSLDATTGRVTLTSPPAAGTGITAGFQFDTPVRFDTDRLDLALESFLSMSVSDIPLVEVRV